MHPLKGRKQSKEHIAARIAAMKGKKRKLGGGRPANTPDVIWSKVDKRGKKECWPWLGWIGTGGYGRTEINDHSYYAHRVIYSLTHPGAIELAASKNSYVLHKCDNAICCNPRHLYLGTHTQNMADKAKRGRTPDYSGDKGPRCLLTMDQVRQIRSLRKSGVSARELAARYKISLPSIKTLLAGKSYME